MKIKEIRSKSIIVKSNLPDCDYVINPYIGCQHGCKYCYAKFMKKYTNHKERWGGFVDIKINAPELIKNNKKWKKKYKNKRILLSSVTDAYQPLEQKYKITRKILKKLVEIQPKLSILTKSKLVIRDINLFRKFDNISVGVSVSTLNNNISKELEPKTPLPKIRLKILRELKNNNVQTYVFLSPIFPEITNINKIMEKSNPYVDYFMFENFNYKSTNKEIINKFLKKMNLLKFYNKIYSSKNNGYWKNMKNNIKKLCEKYNKECFLYFHH